MARVRIPTKIFQGVLVASSSKRGLIQIRRLETTYIYKKGILENKILNIHIKLKKKNN